jgi:hypothetical protein
MNELDWKQPALVGGLMAGILSSIPLVGAANCCFCAWLLVGGAVAAKMLINRTQRPVRNGEGAQVGAMAGLIAAGIYSLIYLTLVVFGVGQGFEQELLNQIRDMSNDPRIQEDIQKIIEAGANQTQAQRIVYALISAVIASVLFIGFSTLGGLLGVALFEKRKGQPPPQYPSGYPPQNPPNYPPNYPPQYPPQSGGSGGDQGGWPQG